MASTRQTDATKSERFHIRATARQASLIKAGAARRNANLTDYIVESTCTRAEIDLADQNRFVLKPKEWDAFVKALDAPPQVPSGIKHLFAKGRVAESR
jgi:uncharacterized protein (DUF1778 family)